MFCASAEDLGRRKYSPASGGQLKAPEKGAVNDLRLVVLVPPRQGHEQRSCWRFRGRRRVCLGSRQLPIPPPIHALAEGYGARLAVRVARAPKLLDSSRGPRCTLQPTKLADKSLESRLTHALGLCELLAFCHAQLRTDRRGALRWSEARRELLAPVTDSRALAAGKEGCSFWAVEDPAASPM